MLYKQQDFGKEYGVPVLSINKKLNGLRELKGR